jgi:hypothetical protein
MEKPLVSLLRPLRRRLRWRDGHRLMVRTLWMPALAAAVSLFTSRLVALSNYRTWAWAPLVVWVVAVPGYSLLRPLPLLWVARRVDAELSLRDRLATALELGSRQNGKSADRQGKRAAHFDPALVLRQREDALSVAHTIDPRHAFPLRWSRRPLAWAAGCLVVAILLTRLPNPMDAVLEERATIAEAAEKQAQELEELAEELEADETLDPGDREELLRQLREAIEALRENPGEREEALADLAKLEEALRSQLDPQTAARRGALEGLATDLADLAGMSDSDPSLDEAARLLQELAARAAEMSQEERESLARALEEAAARMAGSDSALASGLSQLARSVRDGQPSALGAQSAAEALRAAAADGALQGALSQALNQARDSSTAIAQAGQRGDVAQSSGQGQGQGQGQSQGQGQGTGQSQGQGQGQGQGQIGSGGGTTARTGPPGTRPGRPGDPIGPNRDYQVNDLDTVFVPWQQGQPGDPDFLPGRQTGQGQETVRERTQPQPGAPGAALVPYSEVYASYSAAAVEAMEREYVPSGLRDYVREYFTLLEP